jgi:hypothetical protein
MAKNELLDIENSSVRKFGWLVLAWVSTVKYKFD